MNDIYKNTKDAIHIDIPGGEPLLLEISEHFEYLQNSGNRSNLKQLFFVWLFNGIVSLRNYTNYQLKTSTDLTEIFGLKNY